MKLAEDRRSTVDGVPLLDLKAQYKSIRDEVEDAIREVCESQRFVMGPKVLELEAAIADYSQAKHGVGVSSGTDALLVALMALDIGPGDEVITTPFTFFATAGVIARLGAQPVFCDIDSRTFNLDPESVRGFIERDCELVDQGLLNRRTGRTIRAIMPVHLFGQMADMDALMSIASSHGLHVVEDAAQAIGAEDSQGRRAGSIGDIGCFSFFPSKNLGAFGDGGMCVAQDENLAERLRVLRVHGGKPKYYHAAIGGNFRLDAIQAAVLLVKLARLDDWTASRQANAARLNELLEAHSEQIVRPYAVTGNRHIYNQYTIRVPHRDELRSYLSEQNVGCEIYYPVPLHLQKCFAYLGYEAGAFPEAEAASESVISIPVYPELSDEQLVYVTDCLSGFLNTR